MMNNKEHFDFLVSAKILKPEDDIERVRNLVNLLLEALFIPTKGRRLTNADPIRIKHFKIDDKEPINWGDLGCSGVKYDHHGGYNVLIDEASPGACPTLCEYVEKYMKSYGWDVYCETEW